MLTIALEPLQEARPQQVHVTGADDESHAFAHQPIGHRRVSLLAALVVVELEDARRDPCCLGADERAGIRLVRGHRLNRQSVVDQGLQVRPLAGDEDADHATLPMTWPAEASLAGTTAHIPMPTLKTRRCSSSLTPCSVSQA